MSASVLAFVLTGEASMIEIMHIKAHVRCFCLAVAMLLTLTGSVSFAEDTFDDSQLSSSIADVVREMAEINVVMGSAVGYARVRPKQYDNFLALQEHATADELMLLLNHPSPAVRCYAFDALRLLKTPTEILQVVMAHLDDDIEVQMHFDCMIFRTKVADHMIDGLTRDADGKLDLSALHEALVLGGFNLSNVMWAVMAVPVEEKFYLKIQTMALENGDWASMEKLLAYQKPNDWKIIRDVYELNKQEGKKNFSVFHTIAAFPLPELRPILVDALPDTFGQTHYSNSWGELYRAISAYKDEDALIQLQRAFTEESNPNMRRYHLAYIFDAVSAHEDAIYNALKWRLWEEEGYISVEMLAYLSQLSEERALSLAWKSLNNMLALHYGDDHWEDVFLALLTYVFEKDEASVDADDIVEWLTNADGYFFPKVAAFCESYPREKWVAPLLVRMYSEDDVEVLMAAAKALLAYKRPDINQQVLAWIQNPSVAFHDGDMRQIAEMLAAHQLAMPE